MSDGGSDPGAETRRVVQAVAVTVFLTAGIAFSGWVAFGGDGSTGKQAGPLPWDRATPAPSATADATAPDDVYPAPETGAPTDLPSGLPSASPSGLPSAYPSGSPDASSSAPPLTGSAPPAGFSTERDQEGFDIAVPDGWRRTVEGPSVFYTSPDDSTKIQVFELHGPRPPRTSRRRRPSGWRPVAAAMSRSPWPSWARPPWIPPSWSTRTRARSPVPAGYSTAASPRRTAPCTRC
ncbi:hypothetical protein [Streptomyces sp. RTd22]|uniref:hypothetical protein n=1 Tax=Streptomyces sp. RTd22 TaxID=1841249 RepID=UPI001F3FDEAA|nr:hypothetical protein [Streptomyces sp. RTd22]